MNRYSQPAGRGGQAREANAKMRSSMTIWSAAAALVVVILLILGLSTSASSDFYKKGAIAAAILLLVIRQIGRRLRGRASAAAQPDPQSKLNLD